MARYRPVREIQRSPLRQASLLVAIALLTGVGCRTKRAEPDIKVRSAKIDANNSDQLNVDLEVPEGTYRVFMASQLYNGTYRDLRLITPETIAARDGVIRIQIDVTNSSLPAGGAPPQKLRIGLNVDEDTRLVEFDFARDRRLTITPDSSSAIFDCGEKCWGQIVDDDMLNLTLPPSVTVTIDGHKYASSGKVHVDVVPQLAKIGFKRDASVPLALEVQVDTNTKLTGVVDLSRHDVRRNVLKAFAAASRGKGVVLGAEDTPPAKPRAISLGDSVFGEWTRFDQIDLVATRESVKRPIADCGTYKDTTTGELRAIHRETVNHLYKVYDRRSGALKTQHEVLARAPNCPQTMSNSPGNLLSNEASTDEGGAYLKTLVR